MRGGGPAGQPACERPRLPPAWEPAAHCRGRGSRARPAGACEGPEDARFTPAAPRSIKEPAGEAADRESCPPGAVPSADGAAAPAGGGQGGPCARGRPALGGRAAGERACGPGGRGLSAAAAGLGTSRACPRARRARGVCVAGRSPCVAAWGPAGCGVHPGAGARPALAAPASGAEPPAPVPAAPRVPAPVGVDSGPPCGRSCLAGSCCRR